MASVYDFDETFEAKSRSTEYLGSCKRARFIKPSPADRSHIGTISSTSDDSRAVLRSGNASNANATPATPIACAVAGKMKIPRISLPVIKKTRKRRRPRKRCLFNGFEYTLANQTPSGRTYWVCSNSTKCQAKLNFDTHGAVTKQTEHSHSRVDDSMPKETVTPQNAVAAPKEMESQVLATQKDAYSEIRRRLNNGSRRARRRRSGQPGDDEWRQWSVASLLDMHEWQVTQPAAEPWLIADEAVECQDGSKRFLMFGDDVMLKLLSYSNEWWIDGSFLTRPMHFNQLLVVFCTHNGDVYPAVYGLVPCISKAVYDMFFEILKAKFACMGCPTSGPTLIHSDYKLVSWCRPVLAHEFPSAHIVGRYCHFIRGNYRCVEALLGDRYIQDTRLRWQIRKIWALAMLPTEEVTSAFEELVMEFPSDDLDVANYINYFRTTWIQTPQAIAVWNICYLKHRVNSAIEMWHSRLSEGVQNIACSIHRFLSRLKREQEFIKKTALGVCTWHAQLRRQERDFAIELQLIQLTSAYETRSISRDHYIGLCASILNKVT